MNRSSTRSSIPPVAQNAVWTLEVVRGRAVGQLYALDAGETIVGNDLKGGRGLDLVEQEGSSPRKMAGRQATVVVSDGELTIRDLETPGGTFVNSQRLLAGQLRRLVPGDVIQLGSVQVRVKQSGPAPSEMPVASGTKPGAAVTVKGVVSTPKPVSTGGPSPAPAGRLVNPFLLACGAQCRTWDDFLVVAAQKWPELRDELISGRLADYLRRAGRTDLVPKAGVARSADDQLDDWLARVPSTGSSAPELDVHPESVLVRTATGGGTTRQTLLITNVGYRLLRSTARIEPAGTRWVRLSPDHDGQSFATIDQTELPIELELPEKIDRPLIAQIVIDSNGGSRRIGVRIERPSEQVVIPESSGARTFPSSPWPEQWGRSASKVRPIVRIAAGCAGAAALRLGAGILNQWVAHGGPPNLTELRLISLAIILMAAGAIAGIALARRRGEWRDVPAGMFAGGVIGLLAAAFWFALLQIVERIVGVSSNSLGTVVLVSTAFGGLLSLVSLFMLPYRSREPGVVR